MQPNLSCTENDIKWDFGFGNWELGIECYQSL